MRTRAVLGSIFASIAVLVVGWQAGAVVLASNPTGTSTSQPLAGSITSSATTGGTSTGAASTPTTIPSAAPVAAGPADGAYTGSSINTRYGSVQVSVTIASGAITDVTALHLTDDGGKSVQISNRAAPIVRQEVITAQSANVSNISGATYTTQAYLESVQSALDQAGF